MLKIEPIRPEFMTDRQGKPFCSFVGLVDAAHRSGLRSITTEIAQLPSEANDRTTVIHARVVLVDGEGHEYVFTGVGDANSTNVSRNIAPHAIRMAETRSKARALRDALNITVTAIEELGGSDESDDAPQARQQPRTQAPTPIRQTNRTTGEVTELASEAQMKAIAARVARLNGIYEMDIEEPGPGSLTAAQATQRIKELDDLGRAAKAEHAAAQPVAAGK